MPGGRPLKFKSVEELDKKIDAYFSSTPKDEWTWTGLAIALDTTRETLGDYKRKDEYSDSLKRALLKVHNAYEIDLRKKGHSGIIFALKNFGWKDKQEVDNTIRMPKPIINVQTNDGNKQDNSSEQ